MSNPVSGAYRSNVLFYPNHLKTPSASSKPNKRIVTPALPFHSNTLPSSAVTATTFKNNCWIHAPITDTNFFDNLMTLHKEQGDILFLTALLQYFGTKVTVTAETTSLQIGIPTDAALNGAHRIGVNCFKDNSRHLLVQEILQEIPQGSLSDSVLLKIMRAFGLPPQTLDEVKELVQSPRTVLKNHKLYASLNEKIEEIEEKAKCILPATKLESLQQSLIEDATSLYAPILKKLSPLVAKEKEAKNALEKIRLSLAFIKGSKRGNLDYKLSQSIDSLNDAVQNLKNSFGNHDQAIDQFIADVEQMLQKCSPFTELKAFYEMIPQDAIFGAPLQYAFNATDELPRNPADIDTVLEYTLNPIIIEEINRVAQSDDIHCIQEAYKRYDEIRQRVLQETHDSLLRQMELFGESYALYAKLQSEITQYLTLPPLENLDRLRSINTLQCSLTQNLKEIDSLMPKIPPCLNKEGAKPNIQLIADEFQIIQDTSTDYLKTVSGPFLKLLATPLVAKLIRHKSYSREEIFNEMPIAKKREILQEAVNLEASTEEEVRKQIEAFSPLFEETLKQLSQAEGEIPSLQKILTQLKTKYKQEKHVFSFLTEAQKELKKKPFGQLSWEEKKECLIQLLSNQIKAAAFQSQIEAAEKELIASLRQKLFFLTKMETFECIHDLPFNPLSEEELNQLSLGQLSDSMEQLKLWMPNHSFESLIFLDNRREALLKNMRDFAQSPQKVEEYIAECRKAQPYSPEALRCLKIYQSSGIPYEKLDAILPILGGDNDPLTQSLLRNSGEKFEVVEKESLIIPWKEFVGIRLEVTLKPEDGKWVPIECNHSEYMNHPSLVEACNAISTNIHPVFNFPKAEVGQDHITIWLYI